jgi:hypothetical protein
MGLEVARPELVHADHYRRVTGRGVGRAVGDGIQLQDPVLFVSQSESLLASTSSRLERRLHRSDGAGTGLRG